MGLNWRWLRNPNYWIDQLPIETPYLKKSKDGKTVEVNHRQLKHLNKQLKKLGLEPLKSKKIKGGE